MKVRIRGLGALAVATTVAAGLVAPTATAGDRDVERRGSCSGGASVKIKAGPDDGRMEVEAEVDSNRVGQTWRWVLRRDGDRIARGQRTTAGRSGSFEVHRRPADTRGRTAFYFKAVHPRTGQVCTARVVV